MSLWLRFRLRRNFIARAVNDEQMRCLATIMTHQVDGGSFVQRPRSGRRCVGVDNTEGRRQEMARTLVSLLALSS